MNKFCALNVLNVWRYQMGNRKP